MIKLYYRIALSHRRTILTYIVIFLAIFILFSSFNSSGSTSTSYQQKKPEIAIQDDDHSTLSKALVKQLKKENIVNTARNHDDMMDALFFGAISDVVVIPKGFEEDFAQGKQNLVQLQQRPNDSDGVLLSQHINTFLKGIQSYRQINPRLSYRQAIDLTTKDSEQKANISFLKSKKARTEDTTRQLYFNFLSYSFVSIFILVIGSVMTTIYQSEVMKRTVVSPFRISTMNLHLIFANISFGLLVWALFILGVFFINPASILSFSGLLYLLNSGVLAIVCICFTFLVTMVFSNRRNSQNAISATSTILGLSTSFLCGAFVPQSVLPHYLLSFAQFFPTYWYVKLNDMLAPLTSIQQKDIVQAAAYIGIELLFGITFLCIGLAIMRNRRRQSYFIDSDYE